MLTVSGSGNTQLAAFHNMQVNNEALPNMQDEKRARLREAGRRKLDMFRQVRRCCAYQQDRAVRVPAGCVY